MFVNDLSAIVYKCMELAFSFKLSSESRANS